MISVRPLTREEMEANWARIQPPRPKPEPEPRPLNLGPVLDLGNTVVFLFRGRAYAMPPLPWRRGEEILDAWLELQAAGQEVTSENLKEYYRLMERLQKSLSRTIYPVHKHLTWLVRFLHRLRLLPDPVRNATEGDIVELALFVLGRRTTPTGALLLMGGENRGTSWTN